MPIDFSNLFNAAREQIAERIQNIRDDRHNCYTQEDLESAELERSRIEQEIAAVTKTLDLASVACAALENIMLDPKARNAMTTGDQQGRDKLADELRAHLDAIGA
ncbi:hypothetical protein IB236_13075 [Acidovorax sp. ACV02]|uniref:hypothetical protein n=1 Tax=Acidovorax sp. ACV02 TaxID=2769310 RepID=UPI0017839671|nr:hypothetical protein [Acidovorax sp. ACV02]MBD9406274.1 hypothetical protein [Acidovorax sp. ACV02]